MHRSDAMRYFILHQFGGVYADLDMECLRPLDHVTRKFSCIFPPEPFFNSVFGLSWPYIINNAIMMCKPGHPFLEYLMHDLEKTATRKEILYVAGPAFVTEEYGPVIPEIKLESDPHDNPRQHGSRSTTPMGAVDSNRLKTE
ncbi:IMT1-like protein [Mya arenaria]|uniref:IMT1-like protein n=1 Tax=Mya arenaria TaxID=6604 RepID=A0ABY7DCT1_MYAAR|nr:IMT1-like protein [Mya arenaria]